MSVRKSVSKKSVKKARKPAAKRKAVRKAKVKRPNGRPALFRTPEEMQAKIDEYFAFQIGPKIIIVDGKPLYDKHGQPVLQEIPPTVSGLALFLGFSDRTSLYEYKSRAGFSDTVKRAITRIENYAENGVMTRDKPTGPIFWLKNHGWGAEEQKKVEVNLPNEWKRIANSLGLGGTDK